MPTQSSFRLPVDLAEKFDKHVAENSINVSKLIQRLITEYLAKQEVKNA